MEPWITFLFIMAIISEMIISPEAWTDSYFTVAAYEHTPWGNRTRDPAQLIIETNLADYSRACAAAKSKGADIIVFPEYGIFSYGQQRNDLEDFLEYILDPKGIRINPCEEPNLYSDRPIIYSLSCMAKENSLAVVANTGDIQNCTGHSKCPEDGVLHLNTNVAFDKDGTLLAKYHKERLFYEGSMDLPIEEQDPTVKTDFGTFAMFICFDIIFKKTATFARKPEIDAILFSTMWINSSPLFVSTQYWQSFAIGNNATLVASNIQLPGHFATGSGIFNGRDGTFSYTLNPDGISKMVISRVPRSGHRLISTNASTLLIGTNGSKDWTEDGKDMPTVCSFKILGKANNNLKDYRCTNEITPQYSLVKLDKAQDFVEVCSNGMCCSVNYSVEIMNESFYLGIHNGTRNVYNRYFWSEENCFLTRCDDLDGNRCATFPTRSETIFHRVYMKSNFTTMYVYPSVMSTVMRLVPLSNWTFHAPSINDPVGVINFKSDDGHKLLVIGFKGRNYDRDPPYER